VLAVLCVFTSFQEPISISVSSLNSRVRVPLLNPVDLPALELNRAVSRVVAFLVELTFEPGSASKAAKTTMVDGNRLC